MALVETTAGTKAKATIADEAYRHSGSVNTQWNKYFAEIDSEEPVPTAGPQTKEKQNAYRDSE